MDVALPCAGREADVRGLRVEGCLTSRILPRYEKLFSGDFFKTWAERGKGRKARGIIKYQAKGNGWKEKKRGIIYKNSSSQESRQRSHRQVQPNAYNLACHFPSLTQKYLYSTIAARSGTPFSLGDTGQTGPTIGPPGCGLYRHVEKRYLCRPSPPLLTSPSCASGSAGRLDHHLVNPLYFHLNGASDISPALRIGSELIAGSSELNLHCSQSALRIVRTSEEQSFPNPPRRPRDPPTSATQNQPDRISTDTITDTITDALSGSTSQHSPISFPLIPLPDP
ncbi:hypothetical protein ACRALDRAFT_2015102 [Sodiomyces alcalophilus JCM 7366]|uniref:uncharacterized protein n=1 Tax=Sodiomyces alcalophilus JCM 7366 TaxID=591952 RepID=UPI0039B6E560